MFSFGNITAHGQTYSYPQKPPQDLVWTDPKGHTNYWCSVQGDTSGSSSSPRTESRETLPESSELYNWVADQNVHLMAGTVRVELAPSSGKVIVGQIHAHRASNPFVMITWWNNIARIDVRTNPTGPAAKVLWRVCGLGESFDYIVEVFDGVLNIALDGQLHSVPMDAAWNEFPFYFKAGAYVIDNVGPVTEGGWVVYEDFQVYHGENV